MILNFLNCIKSKLPAKDLFFDINKISYLALDTEAYKNGTPFLIMLSNGEQIPLKYPIYYLLKKYPNYHFFTYNLKYDMGNLIRDYDTLDLINLKEYGEILILEQKNEIKIKPYLIKYIKPYKCLVVGYEEDKDNCIYFWDLAQFYHLSLDQACKKYLGDSKIELETKEFTKSYVKKNFDKIKEYCLKDCILTEKLVKVFFDSLNKLKLNRVIGFYSGAAIASSYFIIKSKVSTCDNYFDNLEFLNFVAQCYKGGKFEMTQRGYFDNIYEYDINSAYSYELSNLIDTRFCRIEKFNKKLDNNIVYGFYKVRITNNDPDVYLPCGCKVDNTLVFPYGNFECYVTLEEIKYLEELNIDYKIITGYNIYIDITIYPYRKLIYELFKLKKQYKIEKDIMGYELVKIISNGFYGKTVQVTKIKKPIIGKYDEVEEEINYKLGSCFNLIHGAVITANTRIKVSRLQNKYKDDCIAVHTDSLFLKKELDSEYIGEEIGKFSLEDKGKCIMVGLGQYWLNGYNATRGINSDNFDWIKILKNNKNSFIIRVPNKEVLGWVDCVNRGKRELINLFVTEEKEIDLNCDKKRNWERKFMAKDFLEKQQKSLPLIL
jgi:hypothetical protein